MDQAGIDSSRWLPLQRLPVRLQSDRHAGE